MANYRLFDSDRFLELAPRWGDTPGFGDWAPWVLLGGIPAGLILWLYRYELKIVGGFAARALLTLRLVVLSLLLFLVLWQPRVGGAPATEKTSDRVLVVIDRTGSMEVGDPQRPPLEKLKLARALKLCPDLVPNDRLDQWIAATEREPQWVADNEFPNAPDERLRMEEKRRELHKQVLDRVDSWTRSQMVKRLLEKDGGALLGDLGSRFQVQLLGFANDLSERTPEQLNDLFQWPPCAAVGFVAPVFVRSVTPPELASTDLKLALERSRTTAAQGNGRLRGVILLTDGRHNSGAPPLTAARNLGERKVPLFPVVVGSRDERPAVLIAKLEAPRTLLKDPEDAQNLNAVIKVRVDLKAVPAQDIVVDLYDGKKKIGTKTVVHPGGTLEHPVEFLTALSDEGTHKLRVLVQPPKGLKELAGLERTAETQVVKDKADVLVIDGEARWEYHYLTVALDRDKLIKEVRGIVFEQPRINKVKQEELEQSNIPALKMPDDPATLTGYDCIVLGDVTPDKLLPVRLTDRGLATLRTAAVPEYVVAKLAKLIGREFEDRTRFAAALPGILSPIELVQFQERVLALPLSGLEHLQAYVRDGGGTLVIVAGKQSMPMAYLRFKLTAESLLSLRAEGVPEQVLVKLAGFKQMQPQTQPQFSNELAKIFSAEELLRYESLLLERAQLPLPNTDPLSAMLPVSSARIVQSRQGFPITLTGDGRLNPLLQLSDREADDDPSRASRPERDIWAELPPHYWAVVGKKKSAATTLAYYPGEKKELPRAEQEANSLIAWHAYGRGRVLYVGLDSTWRWRYKVGDQHHHRFWGQLVRWAVNDKLLPGGVGKVRFGTQEPTYDNGKEIEVRLRLDKSLPAPDAKTKVVAQILRTDGGAIDKTIVDLTPRDGQPRTLEGKLRDLPAGAYKIELAFGDLATKLGPGFDAEAVNKQAAEFVIATPSLSEKGEMTDLTTDIELLQQLAILSRPELADLEKQIKDQRNSLDPKKGEKENKKVEEEIQKLDQEIQNTARVYTLDTAREILDQLKQQDEETKRELPAAAPLWQWWPTLLLILGLLTVEWVGRKWAGLP